MRLPCITTRAQLRANDDPAFALHGTMNTELSGHVFKFRDWKRQIGLRALATLLLNKRRSRWRMTMRYECAHLRNDADR